MVDLGWGKRALSKTNEKTKEKINTTKMTARHEFEERTFADCSKNNQQNNNQHSSPNKLQANNKTRKGAQHCKSTAYQNTAIRYYDETGYLPHMNISVEVKLPIR